MTRRLLLLPLVLVVGIGAPAAGTTAKTATCASGMQLQERRDALAAERRALRAARRAYFRSHRSAAQRRAFVRRQEAKLRRLRRRVAACRLPPPPPAPADRPQQFPFFPQAGILWQDLFVYNFVDLDPSGGFLDWNCGGQTYDTHTGDDSIIRSFREQAIGVPVFAALDGRVIEVQGPNYPDDSYGTHTRPYDNHVVLEHANRQDTVYGHLKRGSISVRVGEHVIAGRQIGLTGSSGNSSGPHLHFTARWRGDVYEPFAGPCRPGESGWLHQVPQRSETYVRDFAFSPNAFRGRAGLPWDEAVRTGSFVRGVRDLYLRVELGNAPSGFARVRLLRPDGSVALDDGSALEVEGAPRAPVLVGHYRVDLGVLGRWRVLLEADGRELVDAPLDVVPARIANRPPNPLAGVALSPAAPSANEVVFCLVHTSLATEDPDYDIVRYRYRWLVGGRTYRSVPTAALSDAIPRATALPGQRVACRVTPTDGRLAGPTASAAVTVR